MKHISVIVVIVAVCLSATRDGKANERSDEEQIRQLIHDQETAWNRGDAKAYVTHFQNEGAFTNVVGVTYETRDEFETRVAQIFATIFNGSNLSNTVRKIRFVRPDVAIVNISTEISSLKGMPSGVKPSADGKLRTNKLEVLVKEHGQWWVAAFHNLDVKSQ
jgi:uncharacterized protein (TIGR02246 family)